MARLRKEQIAAREQEEAKQQRIAGLRTIFLDENEGGRWKMTAYFAMRAEQGGITPDQWVLLNPRPVKDKGIQELGDERIARVQNGEPEDQEPDETPEDLSERMMLLMNDGKTDEQIAAEAATREQERLQREKDAAAARAEQDRKDTEEQQKLAERQRQQAKIRDEESLLPLMSGVADEKQSVSWSKEPRQIGIVDLYLPYGLPTEDEFVAKDKAGQLVTLSKFRVDGMSMHDGWLWVVKIRPSQIESAVVA